MSKLIRTTDSLLSIIDRCNNEQRNHIRDMFKHYLNEFESWNNSNYNDSATMAASIHTCIDDFMKEFSDSHQMKNDIKCGKSCSFCCYQRVDITREEAVLIYVVTNKSNIAIDYSTLELQNSRSSEEYNALPHNQRKCVFLNGEGDCTIYKYRPSSCRKLIVVSDASNCDTVVNPKSQVAKLADVNTEVIHSAMHSASAKSASMAEMLLDVKNGKI